MNIQPLSKKSHRAQTHRIALANNVLGIILILCSAMAYASSYDVDAETGYRMERYRAPVPNDVPGGKTVDNEFVAKVVADKNMVLIDVYPPKGLGPDPLDGTWRTAEVRHSLPGAIWLPDVGRGYLDDDSADYFARNLSLASDDNKDKALLFFCTADCWQSWNAALRAINWGYTNVFWYPLGTDGWAEINGDLVELDAINFLDAAVSENLMADSELELPDNASIVLVDQNGAETSIGSVSFNADSQGGVGFAVDIESPDFSDHFLSMRPFKCLTPKKEWFCQQPYPYELKNIITIDDFSDLEYHLLFIRKTPDQFGIDAWNGVYYKLEKTDSGFEGQLLEGDLNVLQEPPPKGSKPIDLTEFFGDDAANRAYPTLIIRP